MLVTLSGMVMLVSFSQPENTEPPMLVTFCPTIILVRFIHFLKASSPTAVTGSPSLSTSGIITSVESLLTRVTVYDLPSGLIL